MMPSRRKSKLTGTEDEREVAMGAEATGEMAGAGAAAATTETAEAAVAELRKQLDDCRAESAHNLDQWRRTAAEFQNYKKRKERDQAESVKDYNASLLTRLLPVVDDMDRAFNNLPDDLKGLPWVEGTALIHRNLRSLIEGEGVREIPTTGAQFDPRVHEALTHEPSDTASEGEIIGEVRKGYTLADRVLRPAQVRVSSGPANRG